MRFNERVIEYYKNKEVTFLFTGGEPTLYPKLLEVAEHARSRGARVAILSNASRSLSWWTKALEHIDQVIFSYHYQEVDREHFIALTAFIARNVPVQVNLVMHPDVFDTCLDVAHEIKDRASNVIVHYKPLLNNWKKLVSYDPSAETILRKLNQATVDAERSEQTTFLRGNLRRYSLDGTSDLVTPTEIILNGENQWTGWNCSIGVETLFVRWDEVYRGVCRVGGLVGSIYDDDLNFPDAPVVCDQNSCNCIAGIKACKELPR
jgi:organic radical activating enzyme